MPTYVESPPPDMSLSGDRADAEKSDSHLAVESCDDLEPNDRIEARRGRAVYFAGRVTELMPPFDLFWATDDQGERRIVEFQEYSVIRVHSNNVDLPEC